MKRVTSVNGWLTRAAAVGVVVGLLTLVLPARVEAGTFYVSKSGNNQDGLTWETAWNELDQIVWASVGPGDVIEVDGGSDSCRYPTVVTDDSNEPAPAGCGMTYTTTMTIGASGTELLPITVMLSDDTGRDGTVRIFGGRATPLGYCGQTDYVFGPANSYGIYLDDYSHLVVDGRKWGGILVYGTNVAGIRLYHGGVQTDVTFRYIEVYDNGEYDLGNQRPDNEGVALGGTHLNFEYMIVHDNGQDAFQGGYGNSVEYITIDHSWLYNQRPHPTETDEPFNYCSHSDGLQIYQFTGGKTLYGVTATNSIIGPGFMQGFILGDYDTSGNWSTFEDVVITNCLFVGHLGDNSNENVMSKYSAVYNGTAPANWQVDNVTSVREIDNTWGNFYINGDNHTVTDSAFYGGYMLLVEGTPVISNNYNYGVTDTSDICTEADPQFTDNSYTSVGTGFADFDYTINNQVMVGVGASITSVAKLFGYEAYIPLTVTVNQKDGQSDPTKDDTINFTAVFSEAVYDFEAEDVTLSGTAEATTAVVTGSGSIYNIAVSGMTGSGTVSASIAAGRTTGATFNVNQASTSTDNTVVYDVDPPTLSSIEISDIAGFTNDATPSIAVVSAGLPAQIAFSCDGGNNWSGWLEYADSISSFNITSGATGCSAVDGEKTIMAILRDALENESATAEDTTVYDSTGPTTPGVPVTPSPTTGSKPDWTWEASTDSGSGLASAAYMVQWCGNSSFTDCEVNVGSVDTNSYSHTATLAVGTWYFRVKAVDNAGNQSDYSLAGTVVVTAASTYTGSVTVSPTGEGVGGCAAMPPGGKAPWLYGALANGATSIKLYFTPADGPVSQYVLQYGVKSGDYAYGVQEMGVNSLQQMTFVVAELAPYTVYYFRIRAANGCAVGPWSNEISVRTKKLVEIGGLDLVTTTLNHEWPGTSLSETEMAPVTAPETEKANEVVSEIFYTETAEKGCTVNIKVTDTRDQPVEGAKVTLHSRVQTAQTDKNGQVVFREVEKGSHRVLITYDDYEGEQAIYLSGEAKEYSLTIVVKQRAVLAHPDVWRLVGSTGLLIIGLTIVVTRLKRPFGSRLNVTKCQCN